MQTRAVSLIEAVLNSLSGIALASIVSKFMFPLFGIQINWTQTVGIVLIFTVVSIIRSYCWRRAFEWYRRQQRG